MTGEDRKATVRRAFEAFGRGEPATFAALLAPDVHYRVIGTTVVSGTMRGAQQLFERVIQPLTAALATPLAIRIDRLAADADVVTLQGEGKATLRSGAPYDNTYCFVFRFEGDRIVEVTEYLDTHLVARAFAVPDDQTTLLHAMDLNMWAMYADFARVGRGGEVWEPAGLTLVRHPRGNFFTNNVMARDTVDVASVLLATREFFGRHAAPFSIWTRDHADRALADGLAAKGFHEAFSLPGMVLLGDPGTQRKPAELKIRPTVDEEGRRAYLEVTAESYAIYGQQRETAEDVFASVESVCAPHVQGLVGWVDGRPVAAAMAYVSHGVAGIGWVGVVTEARGKGYAAAVTWAALREGFRRGGAFANLQASPMGRPVYETMGFATPTHYRVWMPPS
jgi:ketosteroid isomerase-like protein/predicted GNAT family acetyltransferase